MYAILLIPLALAFLLLFLWWAYFMICLVVKVHITVYRWVFNDNKRGEEVSHEDR